MNAAETKQSTPGIKAVLYAASFLVLCVGCSLYFLPDQTDTYFAWTIKPSMTAAFLGGGYLASFVLEILAAREKAWSDTRAAVPGVWVFTTLTLVITLLHLEKFHFDAAFWVTRAGTWIWMGVYIVVPVVMGLLWFAQIRKPGKDATREAVLPAWLRGTLLFQGALMFFYGLAMMLFPEATIPLWPWKLSVFTSQAIGAWGIGIGVIAVQAMLENDWRRAFPLMPAYALLGGLQIVAVARFPDTLNWASISGKLYIALVASVFCIGVYGSARAMAHRWQKVG
jgi:hypothetical protein